MAQMYSKKDLKDNQKGNKPFLIHSLNLDNPKNQAFSLTKVPLQQPLKCLAVSGLVPCHLMYGVMGLAPLQKATGQYLHGIEGIAKDNI